MSAATKYFPGLVRQYPTPLWMAPYKWSGLVNIVPHTTKIGAAGLTLLNPFYTPFAVQLTRFDLRINGFGGAGTFLRLGLYSSISQIAPSPDGGSLLFDSGNLPADSVALKDIAISPAVIVNGWFFAAIEMQDAVIAIISSGVTQRVQNQGTEKITGSHFTQAFGALPAICPATTLAEDDAFLCNLRYI